MTEQGKPTLEEFLLAAFAAGAGQGAREKRMQHLSLGSIADAPSKGLSSEELVHIEGCSMCIHSLIVSFRVECPGKFYFADYQPEAGSIADAIQGHIAEKNCRRCKALAKKAPAAWGPSRVLGGSRRWLVVAICILLVFGSGLFFLRQFRHSGNAGIAVANDRAKPLLGDGVVAVYSSSSGAFELDHAGPSGVSPLREGGSTNLDRDEIDSASLARVREMLRKGVIEVASVNRAIAFANEKHDSRVMGAEPLTNQVARKNLGAPPVTLTPKSTAIRTLTPTLFWTPAEKQSDCAVSLIDIANHRPISLPPIFAKSSYHIPEGVLKPDHSYAWQVSCADGSLQSEPAGFTTLSTEDLLRLRQAEQEFGQSPILMSAFLESLGLYDEARDKITSLPEGADPGLRQKLLDGLTATQASPPGHTN